MRTKAARGPKPNSRMVKRGNGRQKNAGQKDEEFVRQNHGRRRRTGRDGAAEPQQASRRQINRRDTKSAENPKQLNDLGVMRAPSGVRKGMAGQARSTVCLK